MMKMRALASGLSVLALTACVSVLPEPKVPEGLYRFGPMEAAYELDASVIIREPDASRLVAGRAIASEDSSGTVKLVPGVEWTDASTRLMQMAMLDLLGGEGEHTAIAPEAGAQADYELSWRISDFSLAGTTGHCRIRASLLDGRTRRVLHQVVVTESADARGSTNADRARALSEAGEACVKKVAAFVSGHAEERDSLDEDLRLPPRPLPEEELDGEETPGPDAAGPEQERP